MALSGAIATLAASDYVARDALLEALREAGADAVGSSPRDGPGPMELRIGRPGS